MFLSAEILIISYHEWCYKVKQKEGSYNSPVHVEVELLMKLWSLPYHWCIYEFVFQCSARSNKGRLFVCMDSRIAPFYHYFVSISGQFSSIISFWSMVFGLDSYFSCLIVNHNNRAYSPIIHPLLLKPSVPIDSGLVMLLHSDVWFWSDYCLYDKKQNETIETILIHRRII